MDNVLGELFSGIASAIRSKTGNTDSIKPSEFAAQINGIHTGDGSSLSLEYKDGEFIPSGSVCTVQHELNKVPDMIIVYPKHVPQSGDITITYGFSRALMSTFGEYGKHFVSKLFCVIKSGGLMTMGNNKGFDDALDELQINCGHIRNVDAQTFTVGSSAGGNYPALVSGETYGFFAITGLFP